MKRKELTDDPGRKKEPPSLSNEYISDQALQGCSREELIRAYSHLREENNHLKEKNTDLSKNETLFNLLTNNSPVTILFQDRDLTYVWIINPTDWIRDARIIGKTDRAFFTPDEINRIVAIKKDLLLTGLSSSVEITRNQENKLQFFQLIFKAWKDDIGNIIGIATYIRNMTDERLVEMELSKQLEGEKILAEITSQFLQTDISQTVKQIPVALKKMAGYLQADIGFIRFIDSESNMIDKGYDWQDPSMELNDFASFEITKSQFKRTLDWLASHQPIFVPDIHEIPEEAESERVFVKKTGMASLALLPIFALGQFSGYIGFGARKSHPFWSEREKGLLDLFRSLITSVIEWQKREDDYNENRELYHRVLELSSNAIFLIQERNLLYANPAGAMLLGYQGAQEIIGKPFEEVMPQEMVRDFRQRYQQQLKSNNVFMAEITWQTKENKKIEFEFSSLPLVIQGRKAFLTEGVDITHRKKIEKEIEDNRRFLNDILDITPLATYVFDHREDRINFINRATVNTLGLTMGELMALDRSKIRTRFHPDDRKRVNDIYSQLVKTPIGQIIEGEFRWIRPDGEILYLHSYHSAISKTTEGDTLHSLSVLQDITEIKTAQLELKQSEDLYRSLVENIPGAVYHALCDEKFTTVYLSDYYSKLTSIDTDAIINNKETTWVDQVHPEDREKLFTEINKTITSSTPFEVEYRLRKADGEYIWVVDNGCVILDENKKPGFISGIVTDITARKRDFEAVQRLSQENLRLLAQARHDAETKTLLLNEVNHRVKNNIASIIGLIEMERDRQINSTSDFQKALDSIRTRINGLATVHDILSSNQWAPVKLDLFIRKVVENAAASSPIGRKVGINILSQEKNIWINSRQATALALILNELTTNSIRHAFADRSNGAITITIRRKSKTANQIRICYADDGPGWPDVILSGEGGNVGMQVIRLSAISPLYGDIKLENRNGAVAIITFNLVSQQEIFKSTTNVETL